MGDLLDPALLDGLDALEGQQFDGEVWRVTWAARDPLAGGSGGGRWSPDGRFEVLYTSLEDNGAMAEAYYHLSKAPVMSSSHMLLNHLSVSLDNVLYLDVDQLTELGMEDPLASRSRGDIGRSIGEAACMLDYHGLVVPSARWDCENLVIFLDHRSFDLNKNISFVEASGVNWSAWKEQAKGA